ncbi:hypothetical protein [Oceanobacillus sp. J11TS1]|uniref:hypothetical protein n=1 Tax=Oceanobacillus sp. J11TS1 TaxID=2807191 RepID=UPI001B0421F8|nr:hypothetical protein [Oceanobacillus sp. J11TS1]GIO24828.1 hypothetical protein J11TS1_34090 [Oceanobacillus sp. J11TS1]
MVEAVITFGAILTAITALISIFLVKMTSKVSHAGYYPNLFLGLVGILLILVAPIAPKVDFGGAGFGGIGIACMFAAAIGFIISAILDSYKNAEA